MTYVCDHCGVTFPSFEELREHRRLVNDTSAFDAWICPTCGEHFTSPGQLAEHEAREH